MNETEEKTTPTLEPESKLLELARKKFPDLTPAEEKLFRCVETGEEADYSSKMEEENDLANADQWPDNRVLRAACLAWLCTNPPAVACVSHQGIMVQSARIAGLLNLRFAKIPFPLALFNCRIKEGMNLQNAAVLGFNLSGSASGSIEGNGLTVKRGLYLNDRFKAEGEVNFQGAYIGGVLNCENGQFLNRGKGKRPLMPIGLKLQGVSFFVMASRRKVKSVFWGPKLAIIWIAIRRSS